jgi:2-polyprenyl-3-methyl-5-hydroxy-6-metoxy-1,4-benzoquinol methylase
MLALVPPGSAVLDAGCSSGYLAEQLVARGCTVTGLELDPTAGRLAERWCEQVLIGDVETMDLPLAPASFDVVLCGDILEHLRNPTAALTRWRPFLRPGGRLVLSTPNIANVRIRLTLMFGVFRYTERGLLDRTHTHLFTRKTLREALGRAGYRPVVEDYTVPLPRSIRRDDLERATHAVARVRPTLFAHQWVMVAELA